MTHDSLVEVAERYRRNLLDDVIPFWMTYSPDREKGGYYTCLDRHGDVYDTDKFVWLQAREVWMFSHLYNNLEKRPEWLEMALQGADFLEKHGQDPEGNFYFSLTREGRPLVQPYNIFSDCFAAMAFGELAKATGISRYGDIALKTFNNILKRSDNPKGPWSKAYPGARPLKSFSLPMILSNLSRLLEHLLDDSVVEKTATDSIHEVMDVFYNSEHGLILENVTPDGQFSDSFEGRLLNPGHAIEAMWFMMDLALSRGDMKLAEKAKEITLSTLERGWDGEFGGIYYFLDVLGHPPQQLEWDQKLWWVHIETLISLAKGYRLTGDQRCLDWFEKVDAYTWSHFPDPECGEWYGYLNRRGEVLLPLKGGKWKGCFHVPRGLLQVSASLND
ncbi:MAG: AGE family epimerase/isomerase [Bacteroidales bacterium]|jgi:N-acylglucosamine 2-epimerase|nr:AGE family epimerase/isomerase [Bacteroidales bacterium]